MSFGRTCLSSPRLRKAKRRRAVLKISVAALSVVAIFVSARFFFNADFLKIEEFSVGGNTDVSSETIISKLVDASSGKFLGIFPRNNFLGFNKALALASLKSIPKISDASIDFSGLTKVTVVVKEREPFANWCSVGGDKCVFIDKNGYAFEQSDKRDNIATFFYGDSPVIGQNIFDRKTIEKIEKLPEFLKSFGWAISSYRLDGVYLFINLAGNGEIRTTLDFDFNVLAERLSALKPELAGKPVFEYLDLRFGNKAFFK